jgi:hypothetical protein
MSDVSNSDLMTVLLDIKQDIGSLQTKAEGHTQWMAKHVADDALMCADIRAIQITQASQRGAAKVWNMLGAAIGTVLGAVAGYMGGRH